MDAASGGPAIDASASAWAEWREATVAALTTPEPVLGGTSYWGAGMLSRLRFRARFEGPPDRGEVSEWQTSMI